MSEDFKGNNREDIDDISSSLPPKGSDRESDAFKTWAIENGPKQFPGESQDDYEKRYHVFLEEADAAIESRKRAEDLKDIKLKSEFIKGGSEPISIDAQRYHQWLDDNVFTEKANGKFDTPEWHDAVVKVDRGIEFFNSQPADKRKKFLETGDAGVFLPDGLSEDARKETTGLMEYLKEEKVFVRQESGNYRVDADFAPVDVKVGDGSTEITYDPVKVFEKEYGKKDADEVSKDLFNVEKVRFN